MIDRAIFNIDDEYVLRINSNCWKKYNIYKPKKWTDAQGYYEAWSDDGMNWCFGSRSTLNPIKETSIEKVANYLWKLNRDKHYIQRTCMNCAGQNERAVDFGTLLYDTIKELEQMN